MTQPANKLPLRPFPRLATRQTAESRFWKTFKFPIVEKHVAAIGAVSFCASPPYEFCVASSTRVMVYDPKINKPRKTISRFKDIVHTANFRNDGKLLVAGGEDRLVQLFDLSSRAVLRHFRGHKDAIECAKFTNTGTHLFTTSRDKTVKTWDISTEDAVLTLSGHDDYVKCALESPVSSQLIITGSYDHTVRVWDTRSAECVMQLKHDQPVESLCVFASGSTLVSAGGNYLKVWDLMGGGRETQTISNHQKTITSVFLDGTGGRLLSASIDHHVKIYNTDDYAVVHSIKYSAPVLAAAISKDNTRLVVGMSDGTMSIRRRTQKMDEVSQLKQEKTRRAIHPSSARYLVRGQSAAAMPTDFKVEAPRKVKLRSYEALLRRFRYGDALDAALETHNPIIVVSMLEELANRNGLLRAVGGRDESGLQPLLHFLLRYFNNPRYCSMLYDTVHAVLDEYSNVLGQSKVIDSLIRQLQRKLRLEVRAQEEMMQVSGALEMLMAHASLVDSV